VFADKDPVAVLAGDRADAPCNGGFSAFEPGRYGGRLSAVSGPRSMSRPSVATAATSAWDRLDTVLVETALFAAAVRHGDGVGL